MARRSADGDTSQVRDGVKRQPTKTVPDLDSLMTEIKQRTAGLSTGRTFTLAELAREADESAANLLYLKKRDLLHPQADSQRRDRYTVSDLESALLAVELKRRGYAPKDFHWAVRMCREQGAFLRPYLPSTVVYAGMDFVERVQVQVLGRLLQIVAQKMCGEVLPDALIVIDRGPLRAEERQPTPIEVSRPTKEHVISLIGRYPEIPVGWSTADGEIFTRFKDVQDVVRRVEGWDLWALALDDPQHECSYEIVFGVMQESTDSQILAIKHQLSQKQLPVDSHGRALLGALMDVMFRVIVPLKAVVQAPSPMRSRLVSQGDMLSVMADAIVAISPRKWDYCGILLPFGAKAPTLRVAAASREFPETLRERALYPIPTSLPGWVYMMGEPLVIDDVVDEDPRVLFQELERPKAVAVLPAPATCDDQPKGVVYVGARHLLGDDVPAFTETDVKTLGVFAEIVGEVIGRQSLNEQVVVGALRLATLTRANCGDESGLRQGLVSALQRMPRVDAGTSDRNWGLLILAVRINNYDELSTRGPAVASWAAARVVDKIGDFLESEGATPRQSGVGIYRLGSDRFVAFLVRDGSNVRQLREKLRDELARLGNLGMMVSVETHVWSLYFAYADLIREPEPEKPAGQKVDETVDMLIKRTVGALSVLNNIRQGDEYLARRDFANAQIQYQLAHSKDPDNPYHLRHLAQCLIGLDSFPQAIEYARQAVKKDPNYPGSYRRLAEALIGSGEFDQGFEQYEAAIRLDPRDPVTHLRYGQALMLRGRADDIKGAIDRFREAMNCDEQRPEKRAQYLHYIGQAWAQCGDHKAAAVWYGEALKIDPHNEAIWWDLQMAKNALANSGDEERTG